MPAKASKGPPRRRSRSTRQIYQHIINLPDGGCGLDWIHTDPHFFPDKAESIFMLWDNWMGFIHGYSEKSIGKAREYAYAALEAWVDAGKPAIFHGTLKRLERQLIRQIGAAK